MSYIPEVGDICILTSVDIEKDTANKVAAIPCFVELEFQNDYCWLIRYKDTEQCNMIRKSDKRYFFKKS